MVFDTSLLNYRDRGTVSSRKRFFRGDWNQSIRLRWTGIAVPSGPDPTATDRDPQRPSQARPTWKQDTQEKGRATSHDHRPTTTGTSPGGVLLSEPTRDKQHTAFLLTPSASGLPAVFQFGSLSRSQVTLHLSAPFLFPKVPNFWRGVFFSGRTNRTRSRSANTALSPAATLVLPPEAGRICGIRLLKRLPTPCRHELVTQAAGSSGQTGAKTIKESASRGSDHHGMAIPESLYLYGTFPLLFPFSTSSDVYVAAATATTASSPPSLFSSTLPARHSIFRSI